MSGKNVWRKYLSTFLVTGLVLSNASYMSAERNGEALDPNIEKDAKVLNVLSNEKAKLIKQLEAKKFEKKDLKANLNPEDEVRVIVEVEGSSAIEVATGKGLLYKELSSTEKTQISKNLKRTHDSLKEKISTQGIDFKSKFDYTTTFNGFSGLVRYADVEKIESLSNVKKVYLANEYEKPQITPDMTTSHDFIQSYQIWADSKFKGEGMVVAVIDTGTDVSHKDFILTDNASGEVTADEVTAAGLKGKFYTAKVPYAYNYYDLNDTIIDIGPAASMHGMHVAGTVAANGDTENGGIKGVAPEAQVLGMKVFSNDPNFPSTFSDIYLAAIEDAVTLGADVLNMSLGSTSSFYEEDSAEDAAITNAVANGIVASVSAGNSGTIGYGYDSPFYKNPDYGLVGAPGLNKDTIQVAATGNLVYEFTHTLSNADTAITGFGVDDWTDLGEVEVVSLKALTGNQAALGAVADYNGIDVEGKVVLVERGALTFVDKTMNAAAAGAAGIIVYNSTSTVFYKDQGGWDIPFMKSTRSDGLAFEALLADKSSITLGIKQDEKKENPEVGRATDFTSWGVTPDLEFKPELSAPGGNIYSTVNDDKYTVMSGTSMAAPHVSGGAALIQQYLKGDSRFSEYTADQRTRLAKKLLMNTADITLGLEGDEISPRRQGAGMMQLHAAVNTPVVVTDKSTGEAKVNLKDFQSKTFSMTVTAENLTDEEVKYTVGASVLADRFEEYGDTVYNLLQSGDLKDVIVTAPETVTVPANGQVDITISVDLTNAQVSGINNDGDEIFKDLEEDVFVEGFVKLTSDIATTPDLVVPYIGFYGEWDRPAIVDNFEADDKFYQYLFDAYKFSNMLTDGGKYFQKPVEVNGEEVYVISPNGDGLSEDILSLPSLLRNAKELETNVLNSNGDTQLSSVNKEQDVRKNYYNGGRGSWYSYNDSRTWNGKVKNEIVEDGLYNYELKAKVDYENAEWQSTKVPVYVDTIAPTAEVAFNKETNVASFTFADEVGTARYALFVNGNRITTGYFNASNTEVNLGDYDLEASSVEVIEVVPIDHGYNMGYAANVIDDTDFPVILLGGNTPSPYGLYNTKDILVKGTIKEAMLDTVTVNDQDVAFTFDTIKNVYNFETTVSFDTEGRKDVKIEAVDVNGNSFAIARSFFIDVTAPTVGHDAPKVVNNDVSKLDFNLFVKDNFNAVKVTVDGEVAFNRAYIEETKIINPTNETVAVSVDLSEGVNTFNVVVEDAAGHRVVKEVTVERSASELRAERINGSDRYETAVKVSQKGWDTASTVVLARGDQYADALAGVPLAHHLGGPLLLAKSTSLPATTYDEIKRLGASKVVVLGGEGAIAENVVTKLTQDGIVVERISGIDRYETAAKIAGKFGKYDTAVIASGLNFPDALSVSSYAAEQGLPILLTRDSSLPKATQDALVKAGVSKTYVIGGAIAINDSVLASLPGSYRIFGETRYETSLAISEFFADDTKRVFVSTGTNFADALAGGVLAAKEGSGVYIVGKTVTPELGKHLQDLGVEYADVLGGDVAVPESILIELDKYLGN
ncbi:cell wall-binding repeat-containing protein [Paenisporosarcina sp. TG20]|uniref:cell wall-binding repeat-containing protein n=1 Tax=Paenisporosarcina sp. TG20 TaxID=1211706 RepID=UPI0003758EC5|nr:cell wall-binding repeat-containing protein [Paenisporosarcina sp. TG20]